MALDKNKIKGECLNGAYSELSALIGIDAVLKIHSKYRGTQMFFPIELFSKEFITSQIINEYNGFNIRELATKYGYSWKTPPATRVASGVFLIYFSNARLSL